MLISQKVTQDKRVVTDLKHLNIRIVKNNLAYPLGRDMISVLRNSKYQVLLVLDLKDAAIEKFKRYCGILTYFGVPHICIKECLWD